MQSFLIPEQMRAVTFDTPGGAENLKISHLPVPQPKEGEVLIKVMAAGINRPDIVQRQGYYPPPPDANPNLGLEVAGEVIAPSVGLPFQPGDKVCALVNGGGYAEYCTVPATQCLPWPSGFTAVEAAGLPETFFTVWTNLFEIGHLRKKEKLLIHGGSGGIGTTAIQLAHAFGATVYVTAGSDEKCDLCKKLGAQEAINYKNEDFVDRIMELTNKKGVDIILDIMGASYFNRNIKVLAEDGRLIIISFQGGVKVEEVNLARIVTKRITISGSTLRPRSTTFKGEIAKMLYEQVWTLLSERKIKPLIEKVFPFGQVQDAHRLMEQGSHSGKIILDLQKG